MAAIFLGDAEAKEPLSIVARSWAMMRSTHWHWSRSMSLAASLPNGGLGAPTRWSSSRPLVIRLLHLHRARSGRAAEDLGNKLRLVAL